ncbi:FAD-dependent monooxygenase [Streptomyces sp. NPDC089799]|uniref:FAD-dependent monooxygenase n=1 Tax=Streptomyces sp. NPDC089799 TaxID=3155066 RepID=UPI00343E9742
MAKGTKGHAVIAGAGIGGLTAAVALHRAGWRVTVCERAAGPSAAGAGIVLAPNALRAFEAIGFGTGTWAGDAVAPAMGTRNTDGRPLMRADTDALAARYGRPPLAVHRAALSAALADALPADALCYGTRVTGVDHADPAGRVGGAGRADEAPRTGATAGRRPVVRTSAGDLTADVVLAADGIHSPLRRLFFPTHPGLRYSGETAWRTVVPGEGLAPAEAGETWGRGMRFGVVPLADGRVYVYATARVPEGTRPADPKAELARRFGTWHAPLPALLDRIDPAALLQHDLYDLAAPLPRYHHGRIAWLGDAAHAMTPNLGQGGCQAIEDAVVLAHLLDAAPDPQAVPAALARYTAARHPRTNAILVRSRRAGTVAGLTHPLAVALRDAALRATPARAAHRALDGLYGGFRLPPAAA